MQAMVLEKIGGPLVLREFPDPDPARDELRLRIEACGVCRTDLHVVAGELPQVITPIIPGHEIVGRVDRMGEGVTEFRIGERLGVPWLGSTCGVCESCRADRENLCDAPEFTGYTQPGGYATHVVAKADYCIRLREQCDATTTAPLLCAGLIGWRSLRRAGNAQRIGLYGFGAAAHIIAQVAASQGRKVYAFTRDGDIQAQAFARSLGAVWAGGSDESPPERLDAAIIFAPVGSLVPAALAALKKGGRVVCAGIHMSDIPSFPYSLLWEEREVVSVANLTRADAAEFFDATAGMRIRVSTRSYPLHEANQALADLRDGRISGAAVLVP